MMRQIHGTKVQISREGIVSAWETYYVESETEIDDVPTTRNSIGGSGRLDLVEISSSQAEEGAQHVVTAKYEGLASDKFVKPIYAWEPEDADTDIILNPNIKELWVRYKGTWNNDASKVDWAKTLPSKKGDMENPMLGVEKFIDLFGQWTETKAASEIDSNILSEMWSIVNQVPGDFPTPPKRAWFVLAPQITQRGACFLITRRWKLTGVMTPERLEATRLIYTPVT